MTEAEINEEIGLLLRAVRSEQFRFVVVQYNHFALLQQVRQNLEQSYPGRASAAIHLNSTGTNGLSKAILDNKSGFVFLYEFETLLSDATAARTLNQQRDKLSAYPVILVAFLPSGSQWLQDCARKMPDLWSLRTLLLDLKQEISPGIERIFEQIETKRFSDLSVAEKTIEAMDLKARLASLEDIPENRSYKASLLLSLGEIDYLMGNYDNAKSYWEKS